jgi:hypothetical protein
MSLLEIALAWLAVSLVIGPVAGRFASINDTTEDR